MKNLKNTLAQNMRTKLIVAGIALAGFSQAQVWDPAANGNSINGDTYRNGHVGIAVNPPVYPLHVVENSGSTSAGYFDITAASSTGISAVYGNATDPSSISTDLIGVYGEANGGPRNYGVVGAAGGSSSGVNLGGYFRLTSSGASINAAVYADNYGFSGYGVFSVGDVFTTGNYLGSDRKLKTNIKPFTNALDKVMLLKPSTYTYKYDEYKGLSLPKTQQVGLIAQELEEVFPDLIKESALPGRDEKGAVTATGETFKAVNYVSLIPVLIAAIQEQQKLIADQRAQINSLSEKVSGTTGLNSVNGANGFEMLQNEPNPFNGETVVKYTLPENIKTANMLVYDLSGKQITSLPINDRGSSSITLTSEKLAAGIYIYSIVADNKIVDSKRMIVAQK